MDVKEYRLTIDKLYNEEVHHKGFVVKWFYKGAWCIKYHDMYLTTDNNWTLDAECTKIRVFSNKEECVNKLCQICSWENK